MSQRFYGSICVTDIIENANKKHSSFSKADNGKIYADITIWLNDDVDKFGNIMTAQLNPKKDLREQDGQPYIGNFRESERKAITSKDASGMSISSDIPVREKATLVGTNANDIKEPIDDLPF